MKTGWLQNGSSWYYLNDDGSMATSLEKDVYSIDSKGIATKVENSTTVNNSGTDKSSNSSFASAYQDTTTNEPSSSERTVYWTPGGKYYHYNRNCPTLKRSKKVLSGKGSECPKTDPCNVCVK